MREFRRESLRWAIYLGLGLALLVVSLIFLLWSLSYMERGYVATSLLSAITGFTLFSGALYVLRLSAYIYGASLKSEDGGKEEDQELRWDYE
ncbi:MAG: hypothetical protein QW206_05700 [Acidilobaceae archaeon]